MDTRVSPDLLAGQVILRIDSPLHSGYVTETGECVWMTSPGPTDDLQFETVMRAMSEWFRTDQAFYGGANAQKLRRKMMGV